MPALIWLSYASLLALGLVDNIRGPFFPEILNDLHLNGTRGSLFFAVTNFFSFLGSWSLHRLAQRRSSVTLLNISSLGVALGYAAIAWAGRFDWMLFACMLFGYAYGGMNLAQNLIVMESAPSHLRRRLFSGLHAMYGLASLLAPITASAYRGMGLDWRRCFFSLAVLPLLLAVVGLRFHAAEKRKGQPREAEGAMGFWQWARCLLFSSMMACYLWGEISVSTRLALFLRTERGFSPDQADLYLGGFFLTLLAGRLLFGFVHFERLSNWVILLGSAGLSSVFYLLALNRSPLWFVIVGLTMAPFFPIAMEQVAVQFRQAGTQAMGFVIGFGSFSVVAMHLLIGYLTDELGLTRALIVGPTALATIFVVLGSLLLSGRLRKAELTPQ